MVYTEHSKIIINKGAAFSYSVATTRFGARKIPFQAVIGPLRLALQYDTDTTRTRLGVLRLNTRIES